MDPLQFEVNGDAVAEVTGLVVVLSLFVEGALGTAARVARLLRRLSGWRLGMKRIRLIAELAVVVSAAGCGPGQDARPSPDSVTDVAVPVPPPTRHCPEDEPPRIVEIREADPQVDAAHHKQMRDSLIKEIRIANTTVLLGPKVVLDFTTASSDDIPLRFGPCVTLTSASAFLPDTVAPLATASTSVSVDLAQPARTPRSLGPLLRFGPYRNKDEDVFLAIGCVADRQPNDHVRISGFRLHGPSFGQQSDDTFGIQVNRCLDIEISNMEIAGWGGNGIRVLDEGDDEKQPEEGPGQEPPSNRPGDRIGRPGHVRIFGNYIHHNQHSSWIPGAHVAGYGVEVDHGAWARIYENVFDFNRHAIAAPGDTGGYEALRNLVLKGGGLHNHFFGTHTHQFDIHGTGWFGQGGQAGVKSLYATNSFQYLQNNAITIRGRPKDRIDIRDNIFAHEGLEKDEGDDAISVYERDDLDVIKLGPNNDINFDSYGRFGVCDFDGDGADDLFLATGRTWWFSSRGEFQWTYLSARSERLNQVRLGYFDDDQRCDVLTEHGNTWVIASAGTGPWESIGRFGAPLSEVAFGRFDPKVRDQRPGVTKRTTDAFRRMPDGEWRVTPLSAPDWQRVQSSNIPMSRLRFGDFTGDGVTDVLAVQNGRWSISESARESWTQLNPHLRDDVRLLLMADLNHNNIEDVLRLEVERRQVGLLTGVRERVSWWVSDDGRTPWRKLKTYTFTSIPGAPPLVPQSGRFGAAPRGGVLLIDHDRLGHFHRPAEIAAGASPDWMSRFPY